MLDQKLPCEKLWGNGLSAPNFLLLWESCFKQEGNEENEEDREEEEEKDEEDAVEIVEVEVEV